MLSIAGGKGLAAELGLKVTRHGISTVTALGAGGEAAIVGSVGKSISAGVPNSLLARNWRGFTSISGGNPQLFGGDISLAAGTDGITAGARAGYGFGAAIVSGLQTENYLLSCN